jgi:hypothetical protein
MIGLVGVLPPRDQERGTRVLDFLPAPPAEGLSAIMVQAEDEEGVAGVLGWLEEVSARRPTFALGLICPPRVCAPALGAFTRPVRIVLPPEDLEEGALPSDALAGLREASVEGTCFEKLRRMHGDSILSELEWVECLISHAVRGGTLNAVARELGCSPVTVWRRLTAVGLRPGATMSWARLRAYELSVELGADPGDARRAGGWYSRRAWRNAVARERTRAQHRYQRKKSGGGLKEHGS